MAPRNLPGKSCGKHALDNKAVGRRDRSNKHSDVGT